MQFWIFFLSSLGVIKSFPTLISFSAKKFLQNFLLTCHLPKLCLSLFFLFSKLLEGDVLRFPLWYTPKFSPVPSGFFTAQPVASYLEFGGVPTINYTFFLTSLISRSLSCFIAHFPDPSSYFSRSCSWTSPVPFSDPTHITAISATIMQQKHLSELQI